ncbi:hypothetical protein RB195_017410 [Necator americanus]|uniref:BPTI/Kunitz inhibitor domain-containing protein n=1 Tax=Necator americanus TaxID=51031 RepID=A0ABR1C541_NECAM
MRSALISFFCVVTVSAAYYDNLNSRTIHVLRLRPTIPSNTNQPFIIVRPDLQDIPGYYDSSRTDKNGVDNSDSYGSSVIDQSIRCTLPLEQGRCRGYFIRYGFDGYTGRCVSFTYGGCGGNSNNFESLKECQQACLAYTPMPLLP